MTIWKSLFDRVDIFNVIGLISYREANAIERANEKRMRVMKNIIT